MKFAVLTRAEIIAAWNPGLNPTSDFLTNCEGLARTQVAKTAKEIWMRRQCPFCINELLTALDDAQSPPQGLAEQRKLCIYDGCNASPTGKRCTHYY